MLSPVAEPYAPSIRAVPTTVLPRLELSRFERSDKRSRAPAATSVIGRGGRVRCRGLRHFHLRSGSQCRNEGRYQLARPRSLMLAGTKTIRTIVASRRTASPRPKPICCRPTKSPAANPQKPATMMRAAPVMSLPVARIPKATDSVLSPV
jgi:hypothetical protein